jgi:hypothetical protein
MTLYGNQPTYQFTSSEEVIRLISNDGSNQWTDDLNLADYNDFLIEVISDATMTCLQYIGKLHDAANLYQSYWVRRRATYIAAYHFTKRRGDPGLYGEDYQRAIFELEQAADGIIQIPDVPFSSGMMAVMQNVVIDQRYLQNKTRVRQSASTDISGREYLMSPFPYDWL